MSTIQVDRIIPFSSASVTVEGLNVPGLATTGSNTFVGDQNIVGTITASIAEGFALVGGVGSVSTLVATSSFGQAIDLASLATTGSNNFNGNQIITGSSKQTFNTPTLNNQTDLVRVNGVTINGIPFTQQTISVQNYDFGSDAYKNAFVFEAWDSTNYNFGGEALVNGETAQLFVAASGSAAQSTRSGIIGVLDNGNQKVKALLTGQIIEIGGAGTSTTQAIVAESITIGRSNITSVISGSVAVEKVLQLAGQNPLPAGVEGQLANSGSNLYFFSGSDWRQVAFV